MRVIKSTRIPVLICLKEGRPFIRTTVLSNHFYWWRVKQGKNNRIVLQTQYGNLWVNVPIIITMNGFVYDKIHRQETEQLLRTRIDFTFELSWLQKL